jgi:putative transposase
MPISDSAALGAGRQERSDQRRGHRNCSFFPSLLETRRRVDRALWAVVMEAYVSGVSTRKVDEVVAALGCESGISKSEVSRICQVLDTQCKHS